MTTQGGLAEGRGQATLEMIRRHEAALRRTARRYSICAEDADDAYQRALEIALTKAPTVRPSELIRWTQTVTKHEALAIRRNRERLLGNRPQQAEEQEVDWLALVPAPGAGPGSVVERREAVARSREALKTLKPAELRALTLLAEGYSYAEISAITGFSATKVNRCLAEGRERLRAFLARAEAGERCLEMGPLLSAFCDGELGADQVEAVREHLRACAGCRAALRSYRAAPGAAAALAPAALLPRTLLERAQDAFDWLQARLHGGRKHSLAEATAAGAPGAGVTALTKAAAICAGAGGAAACIATGIVPAPLGLTGSDQRPARIERTAKSLAPSSHTSARDRVREAPAARRRPRPEQAGSRREAATSTAPAEPAPAPAPAPVPEAAPPPEAAAVPEAAPPTPPPAPEPSSAGSAAGEFGP